MEERLLKQDMFRALIENSEIVSVGSMYLNIILPDKYTREQIEYFIGSTVILPSNIHSLAKYGTVREFIGIKGWGKKVVQLVMRENPNGFHLMVKDVTRCGKLEFNY